MQVVFLWCVQDATGSGVVGDQLAVGTGMGRVSTIEETPSAVMWFTA